MAVCLAALSLAASPSLAGASMTLGQVNPGPPGSGGTCGAADVVQGSGNTYVVPATGTITSWSHRWWQRLLLQLPHR